MTLLPEPWLKQLEQVLKANILDFWMKHTLDAKNGGFVGEIDNQMNVVEGAEKSLVLNARILWAFASAYRIYKQPEYLEMADRAYAYLMEHFADKTNGGFYWMVDAQGVPSQTKKQVYGQAFVIYALAEYHHAAGREEALNTAAGLFETLEKYAYDPVHHGYIEALAADWSPTEDLSLSAKDMNVKKSMNTHLHVLEGYTGLYRVYPNDALRGKLTLLTEIMIDRIIDDKGRHFHLFQDDDWTVKSDIVSYGHDIEGSWLLVEAAEVLGGEDLLERARKVAITMAEATLEEGLDGDGGLRNEMEAHGLVDRNNDWWPQAEAVVGFYNAYQLTGEARFRDAAAASWNFIEEHIIDREFGEWYWAVDEHRRPLANAPKVSAWKCPYHNSRACYEMIRRLKETELEGAQ
ncbi:AGE family epimerase/isomerase [Paenibacillus sp. NFR01]|uniref:AGE family epimerase/isomerase n=1 Tax=Paenibacillus sp. NFR01 TaxID=1566279 RepID=UPI0008D2DB65|nr:AGE family epimerase/isomerase [Paenibacillus sp. NFR01]SET88427.1 mannobiose 2-epimerase [Paenibacillus sp. NFR01]